MEVSTHVSFELNCQYSILYCSKSSALPEPKRVKFLTIFQQYMIFHYIQPIASFYHGREKEPTNPIY